MSCTRTPTPQQFRTVELTNDVKQANWPVGYLVFPVNVVSDIDYELFSSLEDAEEFAESQGDDWPIYPLYASHRVVNVREPGREV